MAATGRSGGEDRYVAACVRLQTRGCSRKKKKRQECGTRRKETGVAREMRRDANWVGLNDASPLAWSRSVVVVVISWATRPPLNTSNFLSAPPCSLYEFCSIFHYQTLIQRIACVVYDPSALRTTTARDCAKAFFTPPAYRHVTSPYRASYSFP